MRWNRDSSTGLNDCKHPTSLTSSTEMLKTHDAILYEMFKYPMLCS